MGTSSSARHRMVAAAMVVATGAATTCALTASPVAAAEATAAPLPAAALGLTNADARAGAVAALVLDADGRPTLVEVPAPTVVQAARKAAAVPGSDAVVLDTPVTAAVTDPLRSRQWHLDRLRTDQLPVRGDRRASVVAVVDSGVRATHEDFAPGQVLCSRGVDLTSEGISSDGCADPKGHGTHVAGIVAGLAGNGKGGSSVAPGTSILPVRVLDSTGSGGSFAVARGIVHAADQGATVINLSLGAPVASAALDAAVKYATDQGALVVASAGNNRAEGNAVNYPAASPGALSVASVDGRDVSSSFSYSGPTVDLAAPGERIVSTWSTSDVAYASVSGTSMAAPVVSAVASLYRAAHPGATPSQVQAELLRTADDLESAGRDDNTGAGLVDPTELLSGGSAPVAPPPSGSPPVTQPAPSVTQPAPAPVAQPIPAQPVPVAQPAPVQPPVTAPVRPAPRPAATVPAPRSRLLVTKVAKRQRIPVVVSNYKPGSTIQVTETYRVAVRTSVRLRGRTVVRTSTTAKTVRLASFRVAANGAAKATVLPVQSARTGTLTVWGLNRAGKAVPTSTTIRVG